MNLDILEDTTALWQFVKDVQSCGNLLLLGLCHASCGHQELVVREGQFLDLEALEGIFDASQTIVTKIDILQFVER